MKLSSSSPILLNSQGQRISVEAIIEMARKDTRRVLADDDIGTVLYIGDLNIYTVTAVGHPKTGAPPPHRKGLWTKKVSQLSTVRFPNQEMRHQIGSTVVTVSADAVFVIRDGDRLKKVRGDCLKPGMILATGEKIYW